MEENKKNNKVFVYLLVVFFAVFVATGMFLTVSNKRDTTDGTEGAATTSNTTAMLKQEQMVIPTAAPTEGRLSLKPVAMTYSISDEVKLTLSAYSS
ncbi:MAG: hypothetical protein Q8L68_06040, partial [Methylococcales bacterium]|nr:hypothetical protein [Methylococcales bacterium]